MKAFGVALLTVTIAVSPAARAETAKKPAATEAQRLSNASPSADALIQRFVEALDKHDAATLRHLRVSESEYRSVILPGTVPPGAPRRHYRDDVAEYFWGVMNGKSADYEKHLLDTVGGHGPSKVKTISYAKGEQQYADYKAYKQLRLVVEDGSGREVDIRTGSIAEIDGQYKFISFIRD
jgi:hypothetical protein